LAQKLDRFDHHLANANTENPWRSGGGFQPDYDLLRTLLGVAFGTSQQSGIVAGATDVWAAEELRRAGFHDDEVWPRRDNPRVLPRDVRNFVDGLPKRLRAEVEGRYTSSGARKALPAEARVMGSAYTKQADVVVASWAAGVEVLISTKTMLSSYAKNLRNRFEEGYGDAKNLRGRHPLSSLGFLFVVGADIGESELVFTIDMLRKLTTEPDVYDCACLLVVEGITGIAENEPYADPHANVDDEPGSLKLFEAQDDDEDNDDTESSPAEAQSTAAVDVDLIFDRVPDDLSAPQFFGRLIGKALDQMPVAVYPDVRQLRNNPTT
jgi:hypothetical protein